MSNPIVAGLVVVIALMGGFYGGFRYESGQVTTKAAASTTGGTDSGAGTGRNGGGGGAFAGGGGGAFAGGGGGAGGLFGGRGNAGTITNLTSTGFTLHSISGTDTKVTFGTNPTVRKTDTGALSDLSDNLTVTVAGQRDSSGNLVATTITIIPAPTASPGG